MISPSCFKDNSDISAMTPQHIYDNIKFFFKHLHALVEGI